jgi:hypothetical protein
MPQTKKNPKLNTFEKISGVKLQILSLSAKLEKADHFWFFVKLSFLPNL